MRNFGAKWIALIFIQYLCSPSIRLDAPCRPARSDHNHASAPPAHALFPPSAPPDPTITTRVLRLRIKDKHAPWLREMALHVNQVWNYCNELGFKVWLRERRFMSGFDFAALCSLHPRGNEGRPAAPFPTRAGSGRRVCNPPQAVP